MGLKYAEYKKIAPLIFLYAIISRCKHRIRLKNTYIVFVFKQDVFVFKQVSTGHVYLIPTLSYRILKYLSACSQSHETASVVDE